MYPKTIQNLIDLFAKFPTVGPKTAARFVFYLLKEPKEKTEKIIQAIKELKEKTSICPLCFNYFLPPDSSPKNEAELCPICADPLRDKTTICLVEKEIDLEAIEKLKKYKGLYFILGGTVGLKSAAQEEWLEKRLERLIERIKDKKEIKEVILALNPTLEGENTRLWLERKLKGLEIKISRLRRGLPVGGELEYADEETLLSALEGRS